MPGDFKSVSSSSSEQTPFRSVTNLSIFDADALSGEIFCFLKTTSYGTIRIIFVSSK